MAFDVEEYAKSRLRSQERPTPTAPTVGQPMDVESYVKGRLASKEYGEQVGKQAMETERSMGGAIRQAPPRFPTGSVAGSIALPALALAGGPVSTAAGIGLGLLGSGLGEGIQQTYERIKGLPAPETSLESAREIGKQMGAQGAGDIALRGVGRLAQAIRRPMTPEAQKASEFLTDRALRLKNAHQPLYAPKPSQKLQHPMVLPSEATDSVLLDIAHNLAEGGAGGAGIMMAYKTKFRDPIIDKIGETIFDQFGKRVHPDEAGEAIVHAVQGNLNAAKAPAEVIYSGLERVVPKMPFVDIRPIKQSLVSKASTGEELKGFAADISGQSLAQDIQAMPDFLTYKAAKDLRTSLLAKAEGWKVENKSARSIGMAKSAAASLRQSIANDLGKIDPNFKMWWLDANRIYATAKDKFDNRLIRRIMPKALESFGSDPEKLVSSVQRLGPTGLRRIHEAVDEPTWRKFQNVTAQSLIGKSLIDGKVNGNKLHDLMFGKEGFGRARMLEIYPASVVRDMESFADALKVIQTPSASAIGTVGVQLLQFGALADLVTGTTGLSRTDIGVLTLPPVLGYIMTRPNLSKLFTRAIQQPATNGLAWSTLGKIAASIPNYYLMQPSRQQAPTEPAQPRQPTSMNIRPFALRE